MTPIIAILAAIITGLVGYVLGRAKTFFEAKQKAYEQIVPTFLKAVFELEVEDKKELNEAMAKVWLYGSRGVALKMSQLKAYMNKPSRGDTLRSLQEFVISMRSDIQPFPYSIFKGIEPEEVTQLYTQIVQIETAEQPPQKGGEPFNP